MAKALKNWTLISPNWDFKKNFALYCSAIIDKNAHCKKVHEPMKISEGNSIIYGEIHDIETRFNEGFNAITIMSLNTTTLGDGRIIYFVEDKTGEQYFFNIWDAESNTLKTFYETWIGTISPNGIDAYMKS